MAKIDSKQRDLLIRKWCNRNEKRNVIISEEKIFSGATDIEGDIHIMAGGKLEIKCRLSIPSGSEIIVNPGGILILNGARLHNACGKEWKGIKVISKGKSSGIVYRQNNPTIEDTAVKFDLAN